MPAAVEAQVAPGGDTTGAAPPFDNGHNDKTTTKLDPNRDAHADKAGRANLFEDAPSKDGDEKGNPSGIANGPGGLAHDPAQVVDMQEATVTGKKKRKSKSTAARGPTALPKRCGTGFEEYYAEPPLTVDEFEEELDLYHARIETCIQRYRARRRLDNDRTNLFNQYLRLGGIDCTPRMFNGAAGMEDGENLTKDDVRALTATDVVSRAGSKNSKYYASDNADLWTVDFSGVLSGFLSVTLRSIGGSNERLMKVGIDVVDNFLRYLQLHDVCPEYEADVKNARQICDKAQTELPNLLRALPLMPGQFNIACTKLFCKTAEHKAEHDGLDPLAVLTNKDWDAEHIFRATVALQDLVIGTRATTMAQVDMSSIQIVSTRELELEITKMVWPSSTMNRRYTAAIAEDTAKGEAAGGKNADTNTNDKSTSNKAVDADNIIRRAGVVITKHYRIEEGVANQPIPTEDELARRGRLRHAFFLDVDLMDLLCPGMKLRVVMHELNCDLNFVSVVKELLPSFYTFLPQELMSDWKEPRPNEREGPSVDNPDADAEAEAANEEMEDDK
ncbi:uncharacterized protein SPSK_08691 [Sporothrix schenckii 1099-18]|uniref:Argonaute complex, subunit Arb1 n=1 Tax=Sporothrix schenckii 1099-18 TaxID=1397361 RepID=A0A0F2M5H5_SPOSC|nr:uncharacterized protein SPSK_08691 [Sporothrix schenckii 1099-18]KJR84364.1 hypothetical protein SPSK_08691 [Sporothrix schenckii 1099-18]